MQRLAGPVVPLKEAEHDPRYVRCSTPKDVLVERLETW
jgi:hypothetical protein